MGLMDEEEEQNEGEIDPFAELGVQTSPSVDISSSDALESFLDDDDDVPEEDENIATEIVEIIVDEEDDDDDPFAALGVGGPSVTLAQGPEVDALAAFMDDDEEEEFQVESPSEPEIQKAVEDDSQKVSNMDDKGAYKLVLQTVWVDGVLDPGEVSLLARRRDELGITFEEHLELVREMLG